MPQKRSKGDLLHSEAELVLCALILKKAKLEKNKKLYSKLDVKLEERKNNVIETK